MLNNLEPHHFNKYNNDWQLYIAKEDLKLNQSNMLNNLEPHNSNKYYRASTAALSLTTSKYKSFLYKSEAEEYIKKFNDLK